MRRKLKLNRVVFWTPSRLRMLVVCTFLVVGLLFVVSEYQNMNRPAVVNPRLEAVQQSERMLRPDSLKPPQPEWLQIQNGFDLSPVGMEVRRDRSGEQTRIDAPRDFEVEAKIGNSERSIERRVDEVSEPRLDDTGVTVPRRAVEIRPRSSSE